MPEGVGFEEHGEPGRFLPFRGGVAFLPAALEDTLVAHIQPMERKVPIDDLPSRRACTVMRPFVA